LRITGLESKRFPVSRQLPAKPNLDHLKSQAKDLLDAHRRGDPEAFARIRDSVPAFAGMSDDALAKAPFALHDAQSAIAREYGCVSWAELRTRIAAMTAEPELVMRRADGGEVPPELAARLREAVSRRGAAANEPTPDRVPVLPLRNAVMFPGAVIPIDVLRPTTLRALEAAQQSQPSLVAIFAQRAIETDAPTQDDLHTTGCLCTILLLHRPDDGKPTSVIIEGVRWITLESLEQVDPYYVARVADAPVDRGDDETIAALDRRLREVARKVADSLPAIRDQALALIERTKDTGQLADIAMASFPVPVPDSAAYAKETQLVRRIERAIALLDSELAKPAAAAPPG